MGVFVLRYTLSQVDYTIVSRACVVLLTGKDETADFCRMSSDIIRSHNAVQGELWVCETLAEFEQKARTAAFFGRWWYAGSADRLSPEDKRAFDRLVKKPAEFGTAVLTGMDFMKYKGLTKHCKKSMYIHELSTSFPSRRFLLAHIQREVKLRNALISQGSAEAFIWRLGESYNLYPRYLDELVAGLPKESREITKHQVSEHMKGVQGASFDAFLNYLLKPLSTGDLKRTNKMFQTYKALLNDGSVSLLRRLNTKSLMYLEIRRLVNSGYIPVGVEYTVDSFVKLLRLPEEEDSEEGVDVEKPKKPAGYKFTYRDMLSWNTTKLRREVDIAVQTTLEDWYTLALLSSKRCYTEMEAEQVLYSILTRSRRSGVLSDYVKEVGVEDEGI